MSRLATLSIMFLLIARGVVGAEPRPPEGFRWRHIAEARLTILCPAEWHYKQMTRGSTFAGSLSVEDVDVSGAFRTGLMLNYFANVPDHGVTPSEFAKTMFQALDRLRTGKKVWAAEPTTRWIGESRVEVYQCRIKSEVQGEEIYQHWMLFADTGSGTVHMVYFEAPVKEWSKSWVAGKTMLDSLRFHKQKGGPQPQSDESTSVPSRSTGEPDREAAVDHFRRGLAWATTGDYDRASDEMTQAIQLDPTFAPAVAVRGELFLVQGDLEKAIAHFNHAIELDPKYAQAYSGLGAALHYKGQLDEAIACYQKAIELDPKLAAVHTNLGNALQDKGHLDEAVACLRKAIELDPKLAAAHTVLGKVLIDKGQLDEAITCLRKAIELDPKEAVAHSKLGLALAHKGQVEEAIVCLGKAIELDPLQAESHCNLGNALASQGQVDEAIACYRQAIKLAPAFAEAYCNLGNALASQGRFAESLAALKRGHELGSKQQGWSNHSAAWVRQAEEQAALEVKVPALLKGEFTPSDNQERLGLAVVCQTKHLHHAATGLYAAAFAVDPMLAEDLQAGHRYRAACNAALSAIGQGEDTAQLDDAERARLRRKALDWLRADLTALGQLLESGPLQARPFIEQVLNHWQKDTDLASLRDAEVLAKLPVDEQKACTQLWADVAALSKRAEEENRGHPLSAGATGGRRCAVRGRSRQRWLAAMS